MRVHSAIPMAACAPPAAVCSASRDSEPRSLSPRGPAGRQPNRSPLKARRGDVTSPGEKFGVPELPEVETIVRQIAPRLEGHRIARGGVRKTDVLRAVSTGGLSMMLAVNTRDKD